MRVSLQCAFRVKSIALFFLCGLAVVVVFLAPSPRCCASGNGGAGSRRPAFPRVQNCTKSRIDKSPSEPPGVHL
eukprot:scaffold1581_cov169-Amphora_coffeaeformis.AAC.32